MVGEEVSVMYGKPIDVYITAIMVAMLKTAKPRNTAHGFLTSTISGVWNEKYT